MRVRMATLSEAVVTSDESRSRSAYGLTRMLELTERMSLFERGGQRSLRFADPFWLDRVQQARLAERGGI